MRELNCDKLKYVLSAEHLSNKQVSSGMKHKAYLKFTLRLTWPLRFCWGEREQHKASYQLQPRGTPAAREHNVSVFIYLKLFLYAERKHFMCISDSALQCCKLHQDRRVLILMKSLRDSPNAGAPQISGEQLMRLKRETWYCEEQSDPPGLTHTVPLGPNASHSLYPSSSDWRLVVVNVWKSSL